MFTNTHRPFPALSNFCWPTNCSRESSVVPFFWHGRCVHGKWDPSLSSQRWVIMLHGRNVREVCWGTGVSGFWAFLAFVGHFDTWKIMSQDFFIFEKSVSDHPPMQRPIPEERNLLTVVAASSIFYTFNSCDFQSSEFSDDTWSVCRIGGRG